MMPSVARERRRLVLGSRQGGNDNGEGKWTGRRKGMRKGQQGIIQAVHNVRGIISRVGE